MVVFRYFSKMWLAANAFYRSELERIDRAKLSEEFGRAPEAPAVVPFRFHLGQKVQKRNGYRYPGFIDSRYRTRAGLIRYDVEADHPDFEGMIHIFAEDQLVERNG